MQISFACLFAVAASDAASAPVQGNVASAFEASKARCSHGHAGVIVTLHEHSREPESLVAHLKSKARQEDVFGHTFSAPHTIRGLSARFGDETLNEILLNAETHGIAAVHADCINNLRRHHSQEYERVTKEARQAHEALRARENEAQKKEMEAELVSSYGGVSIAQGLQQDADGNWGLDSGSKEWKPDGTYKFGKATGKGTVLYQIDTGVQMVHKDFYKLDNSGQPTSESRIIFGKSMKCDDPKTQKEECQGIWVYGANVTDDVMNRVNKIPGEDGNPDSQTSPGEGCDAHGTHTASIAAGNRFGVAKEASIVVIQGLSCIATAQDSVVVKALEWVVEDARARKPYMPAVVLLSLGGEKDTVLNEAVKRTTQHGVNVVVASGNEGQDACTTTPSSVVRADTVAAVNQGGDLASFANYGQCVDLLAPGSGIRAAYAMIGSVDHTTVLSGTSMAAPFVAGAMLQALQLNPQMTTDQTKQLLSCVATQAAPQSYQSAEHASSTVHKLVRFGTVFSSMEALRDAVQQKGTACKELVETLATTRPANGVLAKSPDVNYQTVILDESQVPKDEYDDNKPKDPTPYKSKAAAQATLLQPN